MEAFELIEGHAKLIAHFGMWPSFHDAEVHSMTLSRPEKTTTGNSIPILDLQLRAWVMNAKDSEIDFVKPHGDAVIHFQFEGVYDLMIEGFNNQNVLSSMNFQLIENSRGLGGCAIGVELEHCYEFEANFKCRTARIQSITPYA